MSTIVVQHPTLPAVFNTVTSEQLDAWKSQGWKRVKKDEVPAHLVEAPPALSSITK